MKVRHWTLERWRVRGRLPRLVLYLRIGSRVLEINDTRESV